MSNTFEDFEPPVGLIGDAFIQYCEVHGITGKQYQEEIFNVFEAGWWARNALDE